MGCDIHGYIEKQEGDNDDWELVSEDEEFGGIRSYMMFAALAGVRGQGSIIKEPQGLPITLSSGLYNLIQRDWMYWSPREHRWHMMFHTPTFYTLSELEPHREWFEEECWFMLVHIIVKMKSLLADGEPHDRVRLVMFFDS